MMNVANDFNDASVTPDQALLKSVTHRIGSATKQALDNGANPNAVDENGYSVLMLLAQNRNWDSAKLVLAAGADVYYVAPDGETAYTVCKDKEEKPENIRDFLNMHYSAPTLKLLIEAIGKKDADEVQRILELRKIIDINLPASSSGGWTVVEKCLSEDAPVCLDLVLQAGASPNKTDGKMPLMSAINTWHSNPVMVRILLEAGADPDAADSSNYRPLPRAAERGLESIITLLLEHGADVNVNANEGDTAIHEAAEKGYPEIIRILAARGADLACFNHNDQPPLEVAILNRHREAFDALLEAGADPTRLGKNGITLIMDAAWAGDAGVIPVLMERGVNIDAQKEDDGHTALMWAAWAGKGETTRALLSLGANVDLKNKEGKTALDIAREKGHIHVERMIQEKIAQEAAQGLRAAPPAAKPFRLMLRSKNVP